MTETHCSACGGDLWSCSCTIEARMRLERERSEALDRGEKHPRDWNDADKKRALGKALRGEKA